MIRSWRWYFSKYEILVRLFGNPHFILFGRNKMEGHECHHFTFLFEFQSQKSCLGATRTDQMKWFVLQLLQSFNWNDGSNFMTAKHNCYGISTEFHNFGVKWWLPNERLEKFWAFQYLDVMARRVNCSWKIDMVEWHYPKPSLGVAVYISESGQIAAELHVVFYFQNFGNQTFKFQFFGFSQRWYLHACKSSMWNY
jgi:hypothetical protein